MADEDSKTNLEILNNFYRACVAHPAVVPPDILP
jgi:hypothetical protein